MMPPEERKAMDQALRAANGGQDPASPQARCRLLIAPGAGHGYMCAARGDYHPEAAAAGWSALLELFACGL